MKIFVATKETQGTNPKDFSFTEEGELVTLAAMEDEGCNCGCKNAMAGVATHKGTTTFKVIESNMTGREFIIVILKGLVHAGWYEKMENRKAIEHAKETARELIRLASLFPIGAILEKSSTRIKIRKVGSL